MTVALQQILAEFRQGLEKIYGPRLVSLVLFGSQARGDARPDSDIDFVVLAVDPEAFRADSSWIEAIDWSDAGVKVTNWGDEDYGVVWSRRVWLSSGAEVEISFAPVAWASIVPLDAGTRRVILDGCRILHDPAGSFERLYEAVQSTLNPRIADAPIAVLQPVPVFDSRWAICREASSRYWMRSDRSRRAARASPGRPVFDGQDALAIEPRSELRCDPPLL